MLLQKHASADVLKKSYSGQKHHSSLAHVVPKRLHFLIQAPKETNLHFFLVLCNMIYTLVCYHDLLIPMYFFASKLL